MTMVECAMCHRVFPITEIHGSPGACPKCGLTSVFMVVPWSPTGRIVRHIEEFEKGERVQIAGWGDTIRECEEYLNQHPELVEQGYDIYMVRNVPVVGKLIERG